MALTTFFAFSLNALRLWEVGKMGLAVGYVILSVDLSVLARCAGIMLVRVSNT